MDIEPQLNGRCHLVDVLSAGTGCADVCEVELSFVNVEDGGCVNHEGNI